MSYLEGREGRAGERKLPQVELGRRSYDTIARVQEGLLGKPSYLAALHHSFFDIPYVGPNILDDRVLFDVADNRYLVIWARRFRSNDHPSSGIQLKLVIDKFRAREHSDHIEVRSNFSLPRIDEPRFTSGGVWISHGGGPYEDTETAYKKVEEALQDFIVPAATR